MQYTNENVLKIYRRSVIKRMENESKKGLEGLRKKIKKHKWLTITLGALIVFSTINIIMVYNFMNLLQKLY